MIYSAQQKLDALRRELKLRQQAYPGYVQRKRMTQLQADYQLDIMRALVEQHEKLAAEERLI